jgi:membrane associated rhomboid family serine protease
MNDMSFEIPPRRREPAFFMPPVVLILIIALLAIHGVVSLLNEEVRDSVYFDWGFVPGRLTGLLAPGWIADLVSRASANPAALASARLLRETGALNDGGRLYTVATYAFLHGSWTHVGVNCIWMAAFGPPVARQFGSARFALFFLVTAIAGALAHWLYSPYEAFPMIGASAADSGLMAAAARFIFRPGAALAADPFAAGSRNARAATLLELLTDRRALIFIGIWMATNFIFGAGAGALNSAEAPVAWVAHVGGFLAGLLLFGAFDFSWRRRNA